MSEQNRTGPGTEPTEGKDAVQASRRRLTEELGSGVWSARCDLLAFDYAVAMEQAGWQREDIEEELVGLGIRRREARKLYQQVESAVAQAADDHGTAEGSPSARQPERDRRTSDDGVKHCPECYGEFLAEADDCPDCRVALAMGGLTAQERAYNWVRCDKAFHVKLIAALLLALLLTLVSLAKAVHRGAVAPNSVSLTFFLVALWPWLSFYRRIRALASYREILSSRARKK